MGMYCDKTEPIVAERAEYVWLCDDLNGHDGPCRQYTLRAAWEASQAPVAAAGEEER